MITTGYGSIDSRKTEIVDVKNGVTCSDLPNFPVFISDSVGANLDGTPIVCGGYLGYDIPNSEKCYRLTNGGWEEFASMKEKRIKAAGVMYNKKLHVFGGFRLQFEYSTSLQKSEIIDVDGGVSDGPDLPAAVGLHAMTSINDTVSLLSGGITNADTWSAQTWYYNHDTETFTSGPDLLEGRYYHGSATIVDKVTKDKIAVITGGINYHGNGITRLDSTELLINGQWETGTIQCRKQNVLIRSSDISV